MWGSKQLKYQSNIKGLCNDLNYISAKNYKRLKLHNSNNNNTLKKVHCFGSSRNAKHFSVAKQNLNSNLVYLVYHYVQWSDKWMLFSHSTKEYQNNNVNALTSDLALE